MARRWVALSILAGLFAVILAVDPTARILLAQQLRIVDRAEVTLWEPEDYVRPEERLLRDRICRLSRERVRDWRLAEAEIYLQPLYIEGPLSARQRPMPPRARVRVDTGQRATSICMTPWEEVVGHALSLKPNMARLHAGAAARYLGRIEDAGGLRRSPSQFSAPEMRFWQDRLRLLERAAEKHLQKAISLEPGNAYYDQLLAYLRLMQQRDEEAVAILGQAINKPHWNDHSLETAASFVHAYRLAGADRLIAKYLAARGTEAASTLRLEQMGRTLADLGLQAEQAGDHERALRIYELLIRTGWQISRGATSLFAAQSGRAIQLQPAFARVREAELAANRVVGQLTAERPGRWSPRWRYANPEQARVVAALGLQRFRGYLQAHKRADLAAYMLAVQRSNATLRERAGRPNIWTAPLERFAQASAIQCWPLAFLIVFGGLFIALWLPGILLPGRAREKVTAAWDGQGRYAPIARVTVIVLAVGIASFVGLIVQSRLHQYPTLLFVDPIFETIVVALILLAVSGLQMLGQHYRGPETREGSLAQLTRRMRANVLPLVIVSLFAYLVLMIPTRMAVRKAESRLDSVLRHGTLQYIMPGFRSQIPKPPGPDVAFLPRQ